MNKGLLAHRSLLQHFLTFWQSLFFHAKPDKSSQHSRFCQWSKDIDKRCKCDNSDKTNQIH